mmetsp:Transcript_105318/g.339337  ORF Transcript_105318/g.339337 Transcript_105318/m.339337 type:complete len:297 (+) Transcript_105318:65-955(+)
MAGIASSPDAWPDGVWARILHFAASRATLLACACTGQRLRAWCGAGTESSVLWHYAYTEFFSCGSSWPYASEVMELIPVQVWVTYRDRTRVPHSVLSQTYAALNTDLAEIAMRWRFKTSDIGGDAASPTSFEAALRRLVPTLAQIPPRTWPGPLADCLAAWLVFLFNVRVLHRELEAIDIRTASAPSRGVDMELTEVDTMRSAGDESMDLRALLRYALWLECDHVHNGIKAVRGNGVRSAQYLDVMRHSYQQGSEDLKQRAAAAGMGDLDLVGSGKLMARFEPIWNSMLARVSVRR